jgi:hypothetical protein
MTRFRFSIAQLMAIVLYLGFGFAALRNADEIWASAAYTVAMLLLAAALVGAFVCRGRARALWTGFAVFGWTYRLFANLPDWENGGLGFGPITKPHVLIEWATAHLQPYLRPLPPGMGGGNAGFFLMPYEQVSQSLGIILFGLLGAALGGLLAMTEERYERR